MPLLLCFFLLCTTPHIQTQHLTILSLPRTCTHPIPRRFPHKFCSVNCFVCIQDNPEHLEEVLRAEAEFHFARGDMATAASSFARTNVPFEEVVLKFISAGQKVALQSFLIYKLESLRPEVRMEAWSPNG